MKYTVLLLSLIFSVSAAAQEAGFYLSPAQARQLAGSTIAMDASAMGTAKGRITSASGGPVAGANVTLVGAGGFASVWCGTSKKNGSYSVRTMFGVYNAEITAPGYEKKTVEIDVPKEGQVSIDVVLTPKADFKPKAGGNDIKSMGDGYTLSVGHNPYYEGKSLTDILEDAPAVELKASPATVVGDEMFEVYVNGREVRVAPEALMKYLGSIAAGDVKQIKVIRGNKFQKYASKLYITAK